MFKIDKNTNVFVTGGGMHYAMDTMNPVVTFFQSVEGTLLSADHGVDRQLAYTPT